MDLSPLELKFLLRLLEYPSDYRTLISKVRLNGGTKASQRNQACNDLCSKGLVERIEEIRRYQTTPAGRNLLNLNTDELPITPNELKLLKAAAKKSVPPGQASAVPAGDRQSLLCQLEDRGFVSVGERRIKEVGLTQRGKAYLRDECVPTTTAPVPLSMLKGYLAFLRQFINIGDGVIAATTALPSSGSPQKISTASTSSHQVAETITPDVVLKMIRQLDQQHDTDNYLPIFHLREKLQPPLNREALETILEELQASDRIELSTLQDVSNYSEAELSAGIPQNIGGPLFYISVT
ncbi:MAG: hypothetical protein AAFN08_02515 [Cyanobacteria bacterium J06559_3]